MFIDRFNHLFKVILTPFQATQGNPATGQAGPGGVNGHATTKIFNDIELQQMIDPILDMDDTNRDGYIDYPEFVAAQKQRGF